MKVEYALYERRSGEGPAWLCRPLVDDKERLMFSGDTAAAAQGKAERWYAKNFVPRPGPTKREAAVDADVFG
jgi:hypothetical protein